jgi:hypothetical protein
VFDRGRDDVLASGRISPITKSGEGRLYDAKNRVIIGFRAATCENDFLRARANCSRAVSTAARARCPKV